MHVGPTPKFCLRRFCPVTRQGSSLLLFACPECRHIAVLSGEVPGLAFPSPFRVTAKDETTTDAPCPKCGRVRLDDFVTVEPDELDALGLTYRADWGRFPEDFSR